MVDQQSRRALVLGSGGLAASAWEIGLAAGLDERGVSLRSADLLEHPREQELRFNSPAELISRSCSRDRSIRVFTFQRQRLALIGNSGVLKS